MNLNIFVSNYVCLIINVLIIFYGPKYVGVEIFVFNYESTYHIYMALNLLMSNYIRLMMNVLMNQNMLAWNYVHFIKMYLSYLYGPNMLM
jgi:hypothetical protein